MPKYIVHIYYLLPPVLEVEAENEKHAIEEAWITLDNYIRQMFDRQWVDMEPELAQEKKRD